MHNRITKKAFGLARRGNDVLLEDIHTAAGVLVGYRLLGGSIEFGETARDAVIREFREELGAEIMAGQLRRVIEEIYTYDGKPGHQIAFVYDVAFADQNFYAQDSLTRMDITDADYGLKQARWLDPRDVPHGLPVWPQGLLDILADQGV